MSEAAFDGRELDQFDGMISAEEAALLYRYASFLGAGCIVELGSWRGKSAIALARGAHANVLNATPMVYCIEPHAEFVGVYGGKFGPADRKAFFEAMLRAGCAEDVALVNLPSAEAARAWSKPIGLLFVDGDHTEAAVRADVDAWSRFVVDGGFIAFDDAIDRTVGPAHVIAGLIDEDRYRYVETVGKIVILQKRPNSEEQSRSRRRSEACQAIERRALSVGYSGEFALARLAYGSFVSRKNKYMYMETPKAACTSWKRLIVDIEGAAFAEHALPYHPETRRDMLIHQRQYIALPTLLDLDAPELAQILDGTGDWFVFGLSRNPFSRIASTFENKVRLGEPGYEVLEERYGDNSGFANAKEAFKAFLRDVVSDQARRLGDAHMRGQVDLLMPKLISYSRVFRFEDVEAAVVAFRGHLRARGGVADVELGRSNVSSGHSWRDYFDEDSAALVADIYAEDFETFGYDPHDWGGGASILAESQSERGWRRQVVERNAMLARLYRERGA